MINCLVCCAYINTYVGHGPFSHLFDDIFIPQMRDPGKKWKVETPDGMPTWSPPHAYTHVLISTLFYHIYVINAMIPFWYFYYLNFAIQHETASVDMLKHLIKANKLQDEFIFYGLNPDPEGVDLTLIAGLIKGWSGEVSQRESRWQVAGGMTTYNSPAFLTLQGEFPYKRNHAGKMEEAKRNMSFIFEVRNK